MTVLNTISRIIAQGGTGFYCIITIEGDVTDVIKVIVNDNIIEGIFIHGDKQQYTVEDIANMIEMEGAGDGFAFLDDIINIPPPTNQEIADQWKADTIGGRVISFEWPNTKDVDNHYAELLRDGNGNDSIPEESAPDLVGRENIDYTIGADNYTNKDKEIE